MSVISAVSGVRKGRIITQDRCCDADVKFSLKRCLSINMLHCNNLVPILKCPKKVLDTETVSPKNMAQTMADVMSRSKEIASKFMLNQAGARDDRFDPVQLGEQFLKNMAQVGFDLQTLMKAQAEFWQDSIALWQKVALGAMGQSDQGFIGPDADDRRFKSDAWNDGVVFNFIKQFYLLASRYVMAAAESVSGWMKKREQFNFYTCQFVDAMAPTNFALTNADILKKDYGLPMQESGQGFQNILIDIERRQGQLKTRMVDTEAFELGCNLALTPGKVILQNELIQLIQYEPTTKVVSRRC